MSESFQPHAMQHARPPCPSPTPGAYSNSCPLSLWCHPTISSSVVPFSSHKVTCNLRRTNSALTQGFVGFPGGASSRVRLPFRSRRHRFDPWVGKIPWRRKWQPIPVCLPGKSHWQRTWLVIQPMGCEESDTIKATVHRPVHVGMGKGIKFIRNVTTKWFLCSAGDFQFSVLDSFKVNTRQQAIKNFKNLPPFILLSSFHFTPHFLIFSPQFLF